MSSETNGEPRTAPPDGGPEQWQPTWRQDFPIDVAREHYVTRRDFTKLLGLTSLAFVVGQSWIVVRNWLRHRQDAAAARLIANTADVPVGGVVAFNYPTQTDPCLLVRTGPETFVAYDQKCTHLSCAVTPKVEDCRLHCPCHNGAFDLATGRPIAGPPRRPLPKITLEIGADGNVYATGVELRTV